MLLILLLERNKAIIIDYTLAVLKPNVIASAGRCRAIIERIKKENFEIFDMKVKMLSNEEVGNLYYRHVGKDYYEDLQNYNTKGLSAILILINKDDTYTDSNNMVIRYKPPFQRWKELIGSKNPADEKGKTTLRGQYGVDIVKNEFFGSDSESDAYREISIFYFPIPCKAPEFKFDINKISISTLLRFLFPVVPNHPDVAGRLDLFALFGPVLDYHVLDICFCTACKIVLRKEILTCTTKDLKKQIDKLLTDEFLAPRLNLLCNDCKDHILHWSHMFSGSLQTHILTNQEIDIEVEEINKSELLRILRAEKGSSALTILSKISISSPPSELIYTIEHVKDLLKNAEIDYYNRYDYESLQNLILEDRRIRMNYWISKFILKPPENFKIPQLINPLTKHEISNMKSHKFTLLRTKPIVVKNLESEELRDLIILHPMFIKTKLSDFEIKNMIMKLFNRNFYKVSTDTTKNDMSMASNMILMRNYELASLKVNSKSNFEKLKKLDRNIG